jgi:1,4-dihydroxy-2-naphthoate octaprenyltransferase
LFSLGNVANFVSFGKIGCAGTWLTQAQHADLVHHNLCWAGSSSHGSLPQDVVPTLVARATDHQPHCIAEQLDCSSFALAGYAAQSLLAAIGCVQFVSNVIFASWVLKERVSRTC